MNDVLFDTLTRHAAAGASRRAARTTLGAPGQAALESPVTADAKKRSGEKAKQKTAKKAKQKCKQQVGECIEILSATCDITDVFCFAKAQKCCPFLGNCDLTGWIACQATA